MKLDKRTVGLASGVIGIILLLFLALVILKGPSDGVVSPTAIPSSISLNNPEAKATIDLFVMSQCPYGTMAEAEVSAVLAKFGSDVNLNLHYVVTETAPGSFQSLHGQPEVDEDARQLCIKKYYPEKLLGYLGCVNSNYQNAESLWSDCASRLSIDTSKITACATGAEGKQLLSAEAKLSFEKQVTASPTFFVNGAAYESSWDERTLTHNLCALIPESETCQNLPEEPQVNLLIVSDENCEACDTTVLEEQFKQMFF
ncbi:MAG: thioredoxin domain-containing protein, partial [Candidatus Micrarchaeota archaeon]